ncbi:2-hydroxychromene-2-carboxylate isomerase [Caldimonas brevitalea]|uniref:2-hydroxychromene-2-carboxylate isomerase n=1 Tax=Caldimonas brevitalea TaxID=413882 RepID=A0A0G3BHL2_9BURK|nr:2-hydroxychromene-2-carboxylate isomerase [Caldimonas brevitalea]AKJ26841.1 2-hydroxychromene-2-carboxylate isomerase [Caldimonas brevitalea]
MSRTVEYYFAPQSPYAYLGHQRFWDLARKAHAEIRVLPVDLGGKVFPVSGGVPLSKRAPQRQAYRLLELRRFGEYLGLPINVEPRYFPVNGDEAARLIIAVDMKDGTDAAMTIAGAIQRAVWVEELNIADEAVLAQLLQRCELPAQRLDDSHSQAAHERYELDTELAIKAGVFGAPTYVVDGELFWGQDRLDFVERRLAAG